MAEENGIVCAGCGGFMPGPNRSSAGIRFDGKSDFETTADSRVRDTAFAAARRSPNVPDGSAALRAVDSRYASSDCGLVTPPKPLPYD